MTYATPEERAEFMRVNAEAAQKRAAFRRRCKEAWGKHLDYSRAYRATTPEEIAVRDAKIDALLGIDRARPAPPPSILAWDLTAALGSTAVGRVRHVLGVLDADDPRRARLEAVLAELEALR